MNFRVKVVKTRQNFTGSTQFSIDFSQESPIYIDFNQGLLETQSDFDWGFGPQYILLCIPHPGIAFPLLLAV